MKIITIIGARPQFIKAAAVSREFVVCADIKEILVHTGQHYDDNMSDIFFSELEIPRPQYNLGIGGGGHGQQTGRMLEKIEEILLEEKPDCVLVYGDTNSTLAGALAAAKMHIPVAHVEAGLRSFNKAMPEEINRILTDNVADILFTPTLTANENLAREGVRDDLVVHAGDVMYDASLFYSKKCESVSTVLADLGLGKNEYILATVHRAENTDDPRRLDNIFAALNEIGKERTVVLPLHPRTRKALEACGDGRDYFTHITVTEPVGYLDMVMLEKDAALVVTDSGGVQKEAYFFRKPCVTLRDETEWVELVESGWNTLASPEDRAGVVTAIRAGLDGTPDKAPEFYGNGKSAGVIVERLCEFLNSRVTRELHGRGRDND